MKKLILLTFALFCILGCSKNKSIKNTNSEISERSENLEFIEKPKVRTLEIAPIEYATGVVSSDVAVLKAKIIEGLSNRRNIRVIDRSRMNDVLKEHQKQQSLWASDDGRAGAGRQYNANAYVYLYAISKTEIEVTIEDLDTNQQVVKLVEMSNVSQISTWDLSILSL